MFLGKFVKKLFKNKNKDKDGDKTSDKDKKKKKHNKYNSIMVEQTHVEYVKSDDFEIFTYEELKEDNLIDDYLVSLSARTVIS